MMRMIAFLTAPDGRFGGDPVKGRNAGTGKSLDEAVAELTRRFGPDMEKWTLGAYHYARILHHMRRALRPDLEASFDVGPLPRGGDAYTITATGGGDKQNARRVVQDRSDIRMTGTIRWASTIPASPAMWTIPHYRDLYEYWARGNYFPIFFSRPKVESVTEKKFTLAPH